MREGPNSKDDHYIIGARPRTKMAIGKAGKANAILVIALIAVGYVLLSQGLIPGLGGTAAPTAPGAPATAPGVLKTTVSDVTVYFDSYDKYNKNSEITNGNHRVFLCSKGDDCTAYPKNYVDKGFLAEGGSVKAAPGDTVVAIFGLNSTSHYPVRVEKMLSETEGVYNMKAGLAAFDTSPTFTVFRDSDDVMSATNAQAIAANDKLNLKVKLEVTSQQAFGNVDHSGAGNILCFQYNSTCFNKFELDGRSSALVPKIRADVVPTGLTVRCYTWPTIGNAIETADDQVWRGTAVVTAGTVNPAASDQCGNVSAFVYDTTVDLNADNLNWIEGVEDEDGNDIGMTGLHANATLYFS